VTIEAAGESGVVTVTNTPERVYAPLQVTKGFNGSAAALVPGAVVGGGWSCDYAGAQVEAGRWQLPAAGGSVLIARADGVVRGDNGPIRLPATAVCTVVEDTLSAADLVDASYAWGEPTYDPADGRVTLAAGAGNAVTITNTTTRVYGAFQITKSIGLAASLRRPGLQFEGTWTCTYNTDPSVDGTWQVTGEGTDVFSGILLGSVCSVREAGPAQSPSPDPSYVWDEAAIAPAAVTVTQGTTVSVGVTNPTHRVLTGLSVTKRLTGDTAGEPDGQTYALSYDCTDVSGGEHVGAASIANGDTWTTGAVIPVGSTCTVAEGDLPDVLPRDTWGPVVFSLTGPAEPPTTTGQSAAFTLFGPQEDPNATVQVTVTNTLLRQEAGYLVSKVADPPSGTTLTPGDTVTYTLTVTPTGPGTTTGVVVTDDLSGITPYAAVGSIVASQGTAVVSGDLQTLTWDVGTVSGTSPLTLTYQATVSAGAYGATLRNHVTATGEQPPTDCEPCTTENPVEAKWTLEKGSDPASGSTVEPGTAITYELTVTNRSTTSPLPAGTVVTDDLSAVLDHAAFVGLQGGFSGTAVLTGTRLVWTLPAVPANGVQHLRYVVHVDPGAGGVTLRNIATGVGVNDPSDDCSAPTARLSSFAVAAASPCSRVTTHETPAGSGGGGGEVVPEEPTGSGPGSSLAFTGTGPVEAFAILGMLLIGAGVAVLRRRSRPSSID
jgi:fimbrial isopeptide formation D2 family protein